MMDALNAVLIVSSCIAGTLGSYNVITGKWAKAAAYFSFAVYLRVTFK